uniref:Uncharacterized protein n=1 Tax=Heterosigma akashiwo TaxID=2829 RepID=A0A7S4DGZ3_HETAK
MNAQLNHEEWWLKNAGYCLPHDAPVLRSQHEKMKKHGLNHQPSTEEDHSLDCCSEIGQSSNQCFVVATTSHFGDREVVEVGNPNGTGTLFCAKVREVSAQASPVMCKNVQDCMMMYEAGAHSQHDSAASWSCAQPLTMPSELLLQLSFQQVQCLKATNKGGEQGSYNVGMTGGKNDANNSTANKQEKNSCKKTVFYEGDINSFLESLILSDWSLASSSNSNNADDTAEASSSACFLHLLLSPGALIKAMEVFCRFTEIFIQVSLSIAFFNIVPMPLLDSYHALDPILDLCLSMVYTTLPVHYYVNSCCLGGTKHSNLSFKKSRFKFCLTLAGSCLMGANLIMGVLPLLVMRMRWS